MNCPVCRTELRPGARYCQRCGAVVRPAEERAILIPLPPVGASRSKGGAIAALVCGIAGVVFWIVPVFGLVLGLLGTGFGAGGMRRSRAGLAGGRGMAVAGLICGLVALVWGILYLLMLIAAGEGLLGLVNALAHEM